MNRFLFESTNLISSRFSREAIGASLFLKNNLTEGGIVSSKKCEK